MSIPAPSKSNTALVTGASSGIGAEMAVELGRRGWHVTAVARRLDELKEVIGRVEAVGGSGVAVPTDLADERERTRLCDQLAAQERHVAILINNAGRSTLGPVFAGDVDSEISMVSLNVDAVVHLCTALLPEMVNSGAGGILNVASTAAFQPIPGQAGYGATKAFVVSYTHALRAELRGKGVNVTTLCPGPVDTGFGEAAGFDKEAAEAALPSFMWVPASEVARAGIEALLADKLTVIPGVANRVTARFGHLAPRKALLPVLARQHPALKGA